MSFALRGNSAAGSKESRERKQVVFQNFKTKKTSSTAFFLLFIFVDSWKKHEYSLGKKRGPNYLAKLSTLVKNLRKSRIQHYERSKLRFLLEWIKVDQKCQKWSILASFWKSKACGQTVLPDRSLLIWQKLVEKCQKLKNKNATFWEVFKHCVLVYPKNASYLNLNFRAKNKILTVH